MCGRVLAWIEKVVFLGASMEMEEEGNLHVVVVDMYLSACIY